MKMRKRIAALIAAAMIASLMPMTAFAKSDNRVTSVATGAADKFIPDTGAPELKIELKDDLVTGVAFYVNLEGAEWPKPVIADTILDKGTIKAKVTRLDDTTLSVEANGADLKAGDIIVIKLNTKLTGGEATVEVAPTGTVVSYSKDIFAKASEDVASEVIVADPGNFSGTGSVANITLKEPFRGAYQKPRINRTFEIELRDDDFKFVWVDEKDIGTDDEVKGTRVEGKVGFSSIPADANATHRLSGGKGIIELSDDKSVAKVTIPSTLDAVQIGEFLVTGLKINARKGAAKGDVVAVVRGKDLISGSQKIVVAKHTDYTTKLEMKKEYAVETGKEVEVEFTLSEELEESLLTNRDVVFSLSKGAKFLNNGTIEVKPNKTSEEAGEPKVTIDVRDNHNSFEFTGFSPKTGKKGKYNFTATILVPNNFVGNEVMLTAEGKALSDTHEVVAATVTRPVSVTIEEMDVKVGLKQQIGGKIVIKENAKEAILKSYKDARGNSYTNASNPATIDIRIGDDFGWNTDGLRITDADIEVTEGDLALDLDAKIFHGGYISIPVKRQSTEPSTIEITNVVVDANRVVPEGKYAIKVGGNALSKNTKLIEFISDKALKNDVEGSVNRVWNPEDSKYIEDDSRAYFDPIAMGDFINITTKNTEDFAPGTGAKVVSFVIGNNKFIADGEEVEMDAAPYIKDGRTMVPLRYLARALGIKEEAIKFDAGLVTIFKADGTIIQVTVGSKNLVANGMTIPMVAAAEIIDGRTYVPVTEIGGVFGVSGSWDATTQTATFK